MEQLQKIIPSSRQDAQTAYRAARRAGRRFVSEQNAMGRSGLLPILEPLLDEVCGEIPLGTIEVPLKKIRGTYAAGRSSAFAGNFMPLLGEESEFAEKWTLLYESAVHEGIRQPVKAYEYLGYYYIIEGNKRVSVSACCGAYSILCDATRLMPPSETASAEHEIFFELLDGNRRAVIEHMWFSERGRITKLRKLASGVSSDAAALIGDSFTRFRAAYREAGFDAALDKITTGDAFFGYTKIYGFPLETPDEELVRNIRNCRPALEEMSGGGTHAVISGISDLAVRRPLFSFFTRGSKLAVLFAFCGEQDMSAQAHDAGRYALERDIPSVTVRSVYGLERGPQCYERLAAEIREHTPDILFATDYSMGKAALRLSLDFRSTLVLHCHYRDLGVLNTYSARSEEPVFLLGATAASLSCSGAIGYMRPLTTWGGRTYSMQAFAQGARLIRPGARVYFAAPGEGGPEAVAAILARWATLGIDTVSVPRMSSAPPGWKYFPGMFGGLYSLSPEGVLVSRLASTAWHWDEFYKSLASKIIDGTADIFSAQGAIIHFRLGIDSGVVDVHPSFPGLPAPTRRLLGYLRALVVDGSILPIDENDPAEVIET